MSTIIPPACFYNMQGFAGWLNNNPQNKYLFPEFGIPPVTSTLSSYGYKPENVPLCADVTTLSQGQAFKYNQQLQLFYKVYTHNSNAYVDYVTNNTAGPIYYNFFDYKEKTNYNSAVSLIQKLYPFDAMTRVGFVVPFPINL